MDTTYFIRELILLNECVILRGIGGFETSYKNAILDKQKKRLIPPGKKIHFRPDLVKDNGLLEEHIAKSLKISREEASDHIDAFVQEFHDTIRDEGKVIIEGIGEFTLSQNNTIVFKEIQGENYLADSFGLDVLDIDIASNDNDLKKKRELQPLVPKKRKLTGWYIAIGILIVLISVTILFLISSSPEVSVLDSLGENDTSAESEMIVLRPEVKEEDSAIESIGQTIDESTLPKKALAIETTSLNEIPASDIIYYIIAGSFKYEKNAERLKSILLNKGFNPQVIEKGNYVRVIVGVFDDRNLAITELQRIRNQYDQSVWLLEEQN